MKQLYELIPFIVVFIIPLWLILHYRAASRRATEGIPEEAQQRLDALEAEAANYRKRIESLEAILDDQHPKWRSRDGY